MNTQDMIEVMLAHVNGAKIEIHHRDSKSDGGWFLCEYPVWNWDIYSYRVAKTEKDLHIEKIEKAVEEVTRIAHEGGFHTLDPADFYTYIKQLKGE